MNLLDRFSCFASLGTLAALTLLAVPAAAQTGVDDDRVSLPDGPGSLEGVGDNVEIDPNMGQMSWAVPVNIPSGHLTPAVGLSYSSSSSSGPVGVGWSVPMPAIARMTSRGVPEYDNDDYFAADGETELVHTGTDANGDLVYRARFEGGFARYVWVDAGSGEEGYWKVESADGTTSYYGASQDGAIDDNARSTHPNGGTYRYMLVEQVDPFGHRVQYTWDRFDGNRPLLSAAHYAYTGDGAQYAVYFDYETRTDLLSDANPGFEELLKYRMTGIRVVSGDETVREYVLAYESYAASGGFSRLEKVSQYGRGGQDSGELYPVEYTFEYSKALGASCAADDCDGPYLATITPESGAKPNFAAGDATLVDINSDGLPDVVDTHESGAHQFYIAELVANDDGTFEHVFRAPASSTTGRGSSWQIGDMTAGSVQIMDVDGDGRSDLMNPATGEYLRNDPDGADWMAAQSFGDYNDIQGVNFADAKFLDYDNDRRIDVVTSDGQNTTVYRNTTSGFEVVSGQPLGVQLGASSGIDLADMNGDGLQDIVQIRADGSVRYRLNLGFASWTDWKTPTGLSIDAGDRAYVDLEDINGDSIADVVIVTSTIQYAINRNGENFDAPVTITGSDLAASFPDRTTEAGVSVLYADMNGNGSDDIVWLDADNEVTYVELFPVRPNLLSRIENGIGSVQTVTYATAVEHAARAKADGEPWQHQLSIPMQVVDQTDTWVTLTGSEDGSGLHEIARYDYRDGFYDGREKQYRGFAAVKVALEGTDSQEAGLTEFAYDVGRGSPWRNGLFLVESDYSAEQPLSSTTSTYEACELDSSVPTPAQLEQDGKFGVYHPCMTETETVLKERLDESDWVTTRSRYAYDAFGNVTLEENLGAVDVDGDEMYSETEYVTPQPGAWFVGLPTVERTWSDPDAGQKTETKYYYDGDDFVGLESGAVTHGFLSRQTAKVDDAETIEVLREKRDEHGNSIVVIAPNGSIDEADAHRRDYTYDDTGLFLVRTDIRLSDAEGNPYQLRRESRFDLNFQTLTEVTQWMLVQDETVQTARNSTQFTYDDFGRRIEVFQPGDTSTPSTKYTYELGDPFSRIAVEERTGEAGFDQVSYRCLDGSGRSYQSRTKVGSGEYLVTGFTAYNKRGAPVEQYQPYTSDSADCESAAPSDVKSTTTRYDAQFRVVSTSLPGEDIYGDRPMNSVVYRPLATLNFDAEDNADGPYADTPVIEHFDGLGRLVKIERTYREDGGDKRAIYQLHYDATGSFAGYTDPAGNRHMQDVDLLGRVTAVTNPNFGELAFEYDAAGNVVAHTDARGVTVESQYDGANRIMGRWERDSQALTQVDYAYDLLPEGCDLTECTNLPGKLAMVTYPIELSADVDGSASLQGSDRFGYDARRRQVFAGRRFADLADLVTHRTYDNANRLVRTEHPDGSTVEPSYDAAGRVKSIDGVLDEISYTERGLRGAMSYANGTRTVQNWDALMRLESKTHFQAADEIFSGPVFERDRTGTISQVSDQATTGGVPTLDASYAYDAWYRLVSAEIKATDGTDQQLAMTYDELDRVTSKSSVGDFAYDDQKSAVKSAGGMDMDYDEAGNQITRGDYSLAYDYHGRLTTITEGDELVARTSYGSGFTRVARIRPDGLTLFGFDNFEVRDGVATNYVRLGLERIARRQSIELSAQIYPDGNENGSIDAGDAWLAREEEDSVLSTEQVLAASAARLLAENTDATTFLHADNLQNVVAATDEGGALVGQRVFTPLGQIRAETGFVDPYGFTAQEHEPGTDLVYFQYRTLDTHLGRWTSFDPAFLVTSPGSMSRLGEATTGYAYVANNPTNVIDPTGLGGKNTAKGSGGGRTKKAKAAMKSAKEKVASNQTMASVRHKVGGKLPSIAKGRNAMINKSTKKRAQGKEQDVDDSLDALKREKGKERAKGKFAQFLANNRKFNENSNAFKSVGTKVKAGEVVTKAAKLGVNIASLGAGGEAAEIGLSAIKEPARAAFVHHAIEKEKQKGNTEVQDLAAHDSAKQESWDMREIGERRGSDSIEIVYNDK